MKHLGFTGAEAQIYGYLLQHPHATGYEVSKGTGLPRTNAYQALETLGKADLPITLFYTFSSSLHTLITSAFSLSSFATYE